MAWSSVTGIDQRGRWRLRDAGKGLTRVELRYSYGVAGAGIFGIVSERVGAPILRRRLRESLLGLKRRVEAERQRRDLGARRSAPSPDPRRADAGPSPSSRPCWPRRCSPAAATGEEEPTTVHDGRRLAPARSTSPTSSRAATGCRQELRCGTPRRPARAGGPGPRRDLDPLRRAAAQPPRRARVSPIVAVEGGPGYGSIGSRPRLHRPVRRPARQRDLVLVDIRGTGGSGAIDCPDLQKGTGPPQLALAELRAPARRATSSSYRTAAAADDIDDVREALGHDVDLALRRLLRDLPRPVLRVPPRRDARRARPRQRLPGPRRERLVPEHLEDAASAG